MAYIRHHSPRRLKGTICLYVTLNSVEIFPSLLRVCFIRHEHYALNRSDKEVSHGDMRVRIHNEVMVADYRRQRSQKLTKERIACKGYYRNCKYEVLWILTCYLQILVGFWGFVRNVNNHGFLWFCGSIYSNDG